MRRNNHRPATEPPAKFAQPTALNLHLVKIRDGDEPTSKPAADVELLFRGAAVIGRAYLDVAEAINRADASDDATSLGEDLNVLARRFEKALKKAGRIALMNGYAVEVEAAPQSRK